MPKPLKHSSSTHTEEASTVELSDYGKFLSGEVTLVRGRIAVDIHETGMLHFTFISHGFAPRSFGQRFHGAKADESVIDGTWVIPKGSRFYAHPHHIRAITMQQEGS